MKWLWMVSALVACAAVIFGGSLAWREHKQRLAERDELSHLRARAEQGDAAAQDKLGNRYFDAKGVPKDLGQALRWYRQAAEQGNAKAQFNLGRIYYYGEGVKKDYTEAFGWFRKSADQGDTHAQTSLGYMYFYGQGVPRDDAQALTWYRKAAEQGDPRAEQTLGWMYANGRGVPKDYTQAAVWYQKAADQGDAVSQATLGYMYAYGLGVERDRIGALRWYRMAAAQGEPTALKFLKSFRPTERTRYLELGLAMMSFILGILFLSALEFVLPGRKLRTWRQPFFALLGTVFLGIASLNLYASFHIIRYLPFQDTFYLAKRVLLATAALMIVTVVLPAKKLSSTSLPYPR
jgi:TPR repeat protein